MQPLESVPVDQMLNEKNETKIEMKLAGQEQNINFTVKFCDLKHFLSLNLNCSDAIS